MKCPCAYIMASRRNGTLYTGVTASLPHRVYQHKQGITKGFTQRYECKTLVWYEQFSRMEEAIACEKRIKAGSRAAKLKLIETMNPNWDDLYLMLNH